MVRPGDSSTTEWARSGGCPGGPSLQEARDRLLDWDFVLDKDSVAAAIDVSWERRVHDNVHRLAVPEPARS
jgi:hypothetical protein